MLKQPCHATFNQALLRCCIQRTAITTPCLVDFVKLSSRIGVELGQPQCCDVELLSCVGLARYKDGSVGCKSVAPGNVSGKGGRRSGHLRGCVHRGTGIRLNDSTNALFQLSLLMAYTVTLRSSFIQCTSILYLKILPRIPLQPLLCMPGRPRCMGYRHVEDTLTTKKIHMEAGPYTLCAHQ